MSKVKKTFSEIKNGKIHEIEFTADVDSREQDLLDYEVSVKHYIDGRLVNDNLRESMETLGIWESFIDAINWREIYRSQLFEKEVA